MSLLKLTEKGRAQLLLLALVKMASEVALLQGINKDAVVYKAIALALLSEGWNYSDTCRKEVYVGLGVPEGEPAYFINFLMGWDADDY